MLVQVSDGELVDKHTVLELKKQKITNKDKLHDVVQEQDALREAVAPLQQKHPLHYRLLFYVNKLIWEKTDDIKGMTPRHSRFADLAYEIFCLNDKRFRIKSVFNRGSVLKEQKSYKETCALIQVHDVSCMETKLPEIYCLSITYDKLVFRFMDASQQEHGSRILNKAYKEQFFLFHENEDFSTTIVLDDFETKDRSLYMMASGDHTAG